MRDLDYIRDQGRLRSADRPEPPEPNSAIDFDFDLDELVAKKEAETEQLALSLTQILGGQQELKLFLQHLGASISAKDKRDAERAAALSRIMIDPQAVNESASRGASSGVANALSAAINHINQVRQAIDGLKVSLEREKKTLSEERSQWIKATAYAAVGATVAIIVGSGYGFIAGRNAGEARGYAQARDEVAAASWANTSNAAFARQLDHDGVLELMKTCSGQQWQKQRLKGHNVCFGGAASAAGKLQGWRVP